MNTAQKGFTLIELMIVIAIIGILSAIAIPAYQDYTKKARFAEVLSVGNGYKTGVAECIDENAGSPTDCTLSATPTGAAKAIPAAPATMPKNVASIAVADGVITVTGAASAGGKTSVLTPTVDGGVIKWAQSGTCVDAGYCKS